MNKIALLIYILLFAFTASSQNEESILAKGDKAYEGFSYNTAISEFEKIQSPSLDVKRKIAISYWKLGEINTAEALFSVIVLSPGHLPEDVYSYASILRQNGKYQKSEQWMRSFSRKNEEDTRGRMLMERKGIHYKLLKENNDFIVRNLQINSDQQDFSPMFFKNRIVFASSREGTKGIRRRWNQNKLPFLDVYVAEREGDNNLINPVLLGKKLTGKFHDGPVTFNKKGNLMIITRNNYKGKSSKGVVRLKLFSSYYQDGRWQELKPLPFNSDEYSVGHAAFSGDGKWLYFASNMPGGFGGVDIYRVSLNEDGSYGEPENMGESINTEGDELFPFVHHDNEMLFFASDGRPGLGGLDVFLAQIKRNNSIGRVTNMGAPINSSGHDFGFIISQDQESGYFSSDRIGGKGSDDIYSFLLSKPFSFGKTIQGIVKNKEGDVLVGAEVTLFDLISGEEELVITDQNGAYEFLVEEDKTFNLRGQMPNYFDGTKGLDTYAEKSIIDVDLKLERNPKLALHTLILDNQTMQPLDSVLIRVKDNMDRRIIGEGLTSYSGNYLQPLKTKRLMEVGSYNIMIEKEGYLTKTVTYNLRFDREGKYLVHEELDLNLEYIAVGRDLSKMIDVKPIYFNVSEALIRPDAAIELNKIIAVMNANPGMVIELGSHTDARGTEEDNLELSDKRAKASAAYIAARISNPQRIYGKGYGESVPKTVDLSADGFDKETILEKDFINQFEKSDFEKFEKYHQMNRRTEFIIIRM